jgi:hypothetical protein
LLTVQVVMVYVRYTLPLEPAVLPDFLRLIVTFAKCLPVAHIVNSFGEDTSIFLVIENDFPVGVAGMSTLCVGTPVRLAPVDGTKSTVYCVPRVDTRVSAE